MFSDIITEQNAADLLRVRVQTLRKWAINAKGPKRLKIGRRVAYRLSSLTAWVEAQEQDPCQGPSAVQEP